MRQIGGEIRFARGEVRKRTRDHADLAGGIIYQRNRS